MFATSWDSNVSDRTLDTKGTFCQHNLTARKAHLRHACETYALTCFDELSDEALIVIDRPVVAGAAKSVNGHASRNLT